MPLFIALLFLLLLAFLFMGNKKIQGPKCRWKPDPRTRNNTLNRYICMECKVDAFTSDGKPPKGCKRQYRNTN